MLLAALMLLTLGVRLASVETYPFNEDESLSVTAMESIVETGVPLRENGRLYNRALLAHYLMAAPLFVSETTVRSVRLVPIVLSILVLPLVFVMGRRLESRWTGWGAALFLAFSAYEHSHAALARFYMPFQLFFLAAVHLAASYFMLHKPRSGRWLLLAALAAVGSCRFSVELVPIFGLAWLLGGRQDLLRSGRFLAGAALFVLALWATIVYRPGHLGASIMVPLSLGSVEDPWFFAKQFRMWAPFGTTLLILAAVPLCAGARAGIDRRLWLFHLAAFLGPMLALSLAAPGDAARYMSNLFPLGVLLAVASLVWNVRQLVTCRPAAWRLSARVAAVALVFAAAGWHAVMFENWRLLDGFGDRYKALDQQPAHQVLTQQFRPEDLVISTTPGITQWYLHRRVDYVLRERWSAERGLFLPFGPEAKRNAPAPLLDTPRDLRNTLEQHTGRVWLYANYKLTFTVSREMLEVIATHFKPVYGYEKNSGSVLFLKEAIPSTASDRHQSPVS